MDADLPELLRCPRCDGPPQYASCIHGVRLEIYAYCCHCGMHTETVESHVVAAAQWNTHPERALFKRGAPKQEDRPSAAAREAATAILAPTCISLAVNVIDDIATALDAARAQGRQEREAEIVAWAERQVAMVRADGKTLLDAAWLAAYQQIGEDIQRGAGRKEDE